MDSPGRGRHDILDIRRIYWPGQEDWSETGGLGSDKKDWADYQGDPCQVLCLQAGARPGGDQVEDTANCRVIRGGEGRNLPARIPLICIGRRRSAERPTAILPGWRCRWCCGVGGKGLPEYLSSSLHDGTINLDGLPPRDHPGKLSPESRCLKRT